MDQNKIGLLTETNDLLINEEKPSWGQLSKEDLVILGIPIKVFPKLTAKS